MHPFRLVMALLLTKSGQKVLPLFYGTAWKKADTTKLVSLALQQGFRAFDTACQPKHYREDLVGEAIAQASDIAREDLFIQTKFTPVDGQDRANIPYDPAVPLEDQVRQSFDVSLKNLRTTYLDAVLLHSPLPIDESVTVLNVLNELKEKGKVRHLGISNIYSVSVLQNVMSRLPPSTIQIVQNRFYNLTDHDVGIRSLCRNSSIVYQSFWTLTGNPQIWHSSDIEEIASRIGTSRECTFYRFCMQMGITVLDGTTKERHMKEDLAVATEDRFELTAEEMERIWEALQRPPF
jgi:diketogulonate reductase-like aldo/keto reductase